jgi:L-fuconolactonase
VTEAEPDVRIDAHQHYWRLERADYGWIPDDGPLHRDYMPSDLAPLNHRAGIEATIAVQAAPTVAETEWLLGLAAESDAAIAGVVGWAPLDLPDDPTLDWLASEPGCVGLRPMLQDLAEDDWILRRVRPEELERIGAAGLVFELLARPRQLGHALRALDGIAGLTVVVDHLSKPDYAASLGGWADVMRSLASRPDTYCKLSGLVTERGPGWRADDFRRHVDWVIEAFGPQRVIFGSDWPVCLLAASHAEVVELAETLTESLDPAERASVFGGAARRAYGV